LPCGDGFLDLRLDGFEIEGCGLLFGGKSMKLCANFATSCCTKTKRQNSYM
jgi:hypothetical protein